MFENLSHKQKFIALIVLLVVISVTAYKRSFSLTIDAYKTFKTSKEKLIKVRLTPNKLPNLKSDVEYLDNIIGKESGNANVVQQEILNTLNKMKINSELVQLEEIHTAQNSYFNIYTNRLIVTGNYNDLLKTTYQYEKDFDFSRVISSRFYLQKDLRTRRKKLFQLITFQNYEKIH